MASATQWEYTPSGRLAGLNYSRVRSTLKLMRIHKRRHDLILQGLQIMEAAALEALNG